VFTKAVNEQRFVFKKYLFAAQGADFTEPQSTVLGRLKTLHKAFVIKNSQE
jgi:hypothetical protein